MVKGLDVNKSITEKLQVRIFNILISEDFEP